MQLSVNILVDTSASMYGASIQAAVDAYPIICRYIHDLYSAHNLRYSLLTYHSQPQVLLENVLFDDVNSERHLKVQGASNLGRALQIVVDSKINSSPDRQICIIFTDDEATDEWVPILQNIHNNNHLVVVIGCGSYANIEAYRPYCNMVALWQNFQQEDFERILQTYIR